MKAGRYLCNFSCGASFTNLDDKGSHICGQKRVLKEKPAEDEVMLAASDPVPARWIEALAVPGDDIGFD